MMTNPRPISPVLRQTLELGPTLAFFALYMALRDDSFAVAGTVYSGFIVAAVAFVPILLAAMAVLWWLTGHISRMQIFTAFMVIFFGGLTAWFNDERFFKMKTSIVYGSLAGVLGIGLMRGQSYLAWAMAGMLPMHDKGWMILTRRLSFGFIVLAAANEFVWRTMSDDAWVKIETFGFPLLLFGFLWWQMMALKDYMIDTDHDD